MIYTVTVKTIEENTQHNIFGKEDAEMFADEAFACDNVYAVDVINSHTGEVIYYRAKG